MKIEIKNSAHDTRSGFKHVSKLYVHNYKVHEATSYYLNRTWESYPYQSAMKKVIDEAIEAEQQKLRDEYKRENNLKRLSKSMQFENELIKALKAKRSEL